MERIRIAATDRTPEIDFDFATNAYAIRGESYPEDVSALYGPVLEQLEDHLKTVGTGTVEFNVELIYFNSSSAKILMRLFDLLEETAAAGADVTINWYYDVEDDTMEELGEEFAEDLVHARFSMKTLGG